MSGGTWTVQNKVRPGAYINFKSVPTSLLTVGTRGIVTMPLSLDWGDTIIEIEGKELLTGDSLPKIGYTAFDEEAQIIKEALRGCSKAIIYRTDVGGVKATETKAPITATAKYFGTQGNKISFAVITKGSKFDVVTFFNGIEKDRQTVLTADELVDNDYIDWSGTGTPVVTAGVTLSGGTNGTVTEATAYPAYLSAIDNYTWNTMGIPASIPTYADDFVTYIKSRRDDEGRKCQLVLNDYPAADNEGIISVDQGYETEAETVASTVFVATVAGLTAGAEVNESLTNYEISGATKITGELTNSEIIEALEKGQMVLSKRQDGTVKIEQDINTFTSFTSEKARNFSKNRQIRVMDEINNSVKGIWEDAYMGKLDNNARGRDIFKADLIQYLQTLQSINAIQNFDSATDITISQGTDADAVLVDLYVQPVDSAEKLYMTVNIR